jgi:hypothetical protein
MNIAGWLFQSLKVACEEFDSLFEGFTLLL